MQFVEELELIDNYERLFFVEFLEFLGRLAFLIYDNDEETLDVKLWRLLQIIFNTITEKVKEPVLDQEIDSESDYEDELATEMLLQAHPGDLYAGFGILKNSYGKDDGSKSQMAGSGSP